MIANLTRGTKTVSLHLPADRFQIAGVLSYLGVDRLDDYELPCEGQDSSGIMVSLEPTGIAERNIAELCRNEKISLGRLNSGFRSLFKLPYEQQLGVMDRIASQKPEHFDDFRKTIDAATVPSIRQEYYFPLTVNLYTANRWGDYDEDPETNQEVVLQRKGETAFFFCTAVSERNRMNSFMSWVGGKKALRDAIVARLCCSCDRYVEVFGGGAWVLFHKLPGKFEVYNDFNPNLANLYRCVRDHPEELCEELRYTLNARVDFDHIREVLRTKTVIPDIRRAAYFYQIIRESYASGLDSFGAQPHNMWRNFPLITEASKRLQSVVIENKDFEKLIQQYDRPNTIFYLDPPYYETEDYYEDVGFGTADHERLCNALMQIKGKFLLSYNDCPQIRQLYSREGIMIESTTRLSNIAQRYDAGKQYPELLISNYDTYEEGVLARQLTLFDDLEESEKILKEHKIIWKSNVK